MVLISKNRSSQLRYLIIPNLIAFYLYFTGFFTRFSYAGDKNAFEVEKKQRVIYAFWHNQQCFLLYPYRTNGKICALVSMSKDGEYMARTLPKFHMKAMRGSSSRGGYQALRGLIDIAQAGYSLALTPDGPRGPVYQASQGIIYLAQKTNMPIIPAGIVGSHKFDAASWDRFQIPLPFGKCAIVYGPPLWVGPTDDVEAARKKLTDSLNDIKEKALKMVQ